MSIYYVPVLSHLLMCSTTAMVLAGGWLGRDWFLQRRLISRRISGALGSSTRPTSGAQVAEQQRPEVEDFTFDNGDVLAPAPARGRSN